MLVLQHVVTRREMQQNPTSRSWWGKWAPMSEHRFRILNQQNCRPERRLKMPESVPWSMVEPWRARIELNHGQTLERLNERGGLAPEELWCGAHDLPLRHIPRKNDAILWLDWLLQMQ
jgi:hypothetical protein